MNAAATEEVRTSEASEGKPRLLLINPFNPLVSITNVKDNFWNQFRVWKPLGLLVLTIEPTLFGMAEGEAIFRQMLSALEGRGARRQADGAPGRIQKP